MGLPWIWKYFAKSLTQLTTAAQHPYNTTPADRGSSHVEWKRRAAPPPAEHMVHLGTQGKLSGVLLVSSLCGTAVPSACTGLPCPKRGLEGRGEGREDRFRGLSSRPVIPFFFC